MPDQPTDAGKDRETAKAIDDAYEADIMACLDDDGYCLTMPSLQDRIALALAAAREKPIRMLSSVLSDCAPTTPMPSCETGTLGEWEAALRAGFAAARREGQAQERELLDLLEAASAFLFYGGWKSDKEAAEMKRRITAALKAREEPSR